MPIALSKREWSRITKWTERDREDPETTQRRDYLNFLADRSWEMTKNWPNSVENVNKRNEEIRKFRQQAAEQANARFYRRYLKRKVEEQQRLMYSAKDTFFKNKDAPKLLLSAVIETVVQKERKEQLKFKEEQRNKELKYRRRDDDHIIHKAKEWDKMQEGMKQKRFEVNKQHQKEILEQVHEVAEKKRQEYEKELNQQKIDVVMAKQEIEQIKEFEEEIKAAEKARIWSDMERARLEHEARQKELAASAMMEDKLLAAMLQSQCRQQMKRKEVEKGIRDEKLRALEKISKALQSGDAARDNKEQAILDKANKDKEAIDNARYAADKAKKERMKQERIKSREQFLEAEAQRMHEMHTLKQWELMNRMKNNELYDDFNEKLRQEKERKKKEFKEDMLRQWKERNERDAKEKADTRYFYGELALRKIRDADNKLLTHAQHLIEEARANDRPERPILRAVDKYCKMYRLYPMPDLPRSQQEHFKGYAPVDLADPDPWYKEPPKPPKDLGPDAPDDDDELTTTVPEVKSDHPIGRRDGIHNLLPTGGTQVAVKKESGDDAYKRLGRVDGLQERPRVPPVDVAVTPCRSPTCDCPLKPSAKT